MMRRVIPGLQSGANRSASFTYGLGALSMSLSWLASPTTIDVLSNETAVATAFLGITMAIVLGQNMWRAAQSTFWKEWDRVGRMLRSDLQVCRPLLWSVAGLRNSGHARRYY